jgi:hypothetical protein
MNTAAKSRWQNNQEASSQAIEMIQGNQLLVGCGWASEFPEQDIGKEQGKGPGWVGSVRRAEKPGAFHPRKLLAM